MAEYTDDLVTEADTQQYVIRADATMRASSALEATQQLISYLQAVIDGQDLPDVFKAGYLRIEPKGGIQK